jgi:glycosyltransferase involved in cell wall biosynthesis
MKIGIDARLLTEQVTGIGRYTYEMCKGLVRLNPDLSLYTPSPVSDQINRAIAPAKIKSGQAYGRIRRMVWSQTQLPQWALTDGIDVFWGATHRIPQNLDARIARVVTIHDLVWKEAGDTMRPLSRLMESLLMPRAIKSADLIMADSISTAEGLVKLYPEAKEKVRIVYLGAGKLPDPGCTKDLLSLGIDMPYFLFVGTLEPRKNLERLLEAYAFLPKLLRDRCVCVIAGGRGWGGVDVHQLLESLNIQSHVRVLGYVSDEDLSTLYKHARFLAMPSLYEGFGLPLLEAMTFGTPVLTSNCSSMPEVASKAGCFIDPESVDSIRMGLDKLINSDDYVVELASQAIHVANRFSWERASNEAMTVFKEAIEIRKGKKYED